MPTSRIGLLAAALAFGVMLMPTSGFAQGDQHRARGNDACTPDAQRLCKKFFGQGDGAILQCFQDSRTRLGAPCRKFLTDLGLLN